MDPLSRLTEATDSAATKHAASGHSTSEYSIPEYSASGYSAAKHAATPGRPVDRYAVAGYRAAAESAEFAALRRALVRFVFPVTVAFLSWYALYVLLSAYARGLMATKLVGNLNVALLFGLLQFVSTFLIAWGYARYADRRIDPLAEAVRDRMASADQPTGVRS